VRRTGKQPPDSDLDEAKAASLAKSGEVHLQQVRIRPVGSACRAEGLGHPRHAKILTACLHKVHCAALSVHEFH
jgi:hypothetical protein